MNWRAVQQRASYLSGPLLCLHWDPVGVNRDDDTAAVAGAWRLMVARHAGADSSSDVSRPRTGRAVVPSDAGGMQPRTHAYTCGQSALNAQIGEIPEFVRQPETLNAVITGLSRRVSEKRRLRTSQIRHAEFDALVGEACRER